MEFNQGGRFDLHNKRSLSKSSAIRDLSIGETSFALWYISRDVRRRTEAKRTISGIIATAVMSLSALPLTGIHYQEILLGSEKERASYVSCLP